MTTLVAVGCSHMAGSELDGINTEGIYNRQNCFAAKIAKQLGFDYVNLSVSGSSNQFIHRRTIEFLTTYAQSNEDYFYLIGWTSPLRMELRYSENNDYIYNSLADYVDKKFIPFTSGTDKNLFLDHRMKKLTKFVDVLFEENLKDIEYATLVYSLQETLKNNKCKYFMINSCIGINPISYNMSIINKIDKRYFYNPTDNQSSFFEICKNVFNYKNYSLRWHHYEPAHADYSIFLLDLIKKAYQI